MQVSVIVPVYNAGAFVDKAVESALAQPEVAEVILAEDGSADNSLDVCRALNDQSDRVHLVRHPDGGNHGAGATRNLAIRHSTCPYVAFLDADDFYLAERFKTARDLLVDPSIDGVYEAIGEVYQNDLARQQWLDYQSNYGIGKDVVWPGLTTMTERVPPDDLFEALIAGQNGHFHGDGLTVRRSVFETTGLFDENLLLHQDTAMWLKLAALTHLVPGRLDELVAMRRIHSQNRISAPRTPDQVRASQMLMAETLWRWSRGVLDNSRQEMLLNAYLKELLRPDRRAPRGLRQVRSIGRLVALTLRQPGLLVSPVYRRQLVVRIAVYSGLRRLAVLGKKDST
jgi:glycosyltransferase involved in cell wall biosynthesis